MDPQRIEPPLLLVLSDGEWAGRSIESVLEARAYVVRRLSRGREAIAVLRRTPVDAVIVEEELEDMSATDFCRLARRQSAALGTPIVVIASRGISPQRRVEMYTAGAWDYCSQPLDLDVLLLKLDTFIGAKRERGEAREQRLIDPASDLYTLHGLRRWLRELSARAIRGREPLACLAIAASTSGSAALSDDDTIDEAWITRTAQFVTRERRESDVAAYVGGGTFAILAPATGPEGAEHFSERLQRASQQRHRESGDSRVQLQVGYSAVQDFASGEVDADELLRRASAALSHLRRSGRISAVLRFDDTAM